VVVGEYVLKVEHSLMGLPGAKEEDIKIVYSHPQGLMQCSEYLSEKRDWEQVSLQNTAVSAQKVIREKNPAQAAIASTLAAEYYGLDILKSCINDNKNNSTRFIIIHKSRVFEPQADSISISFQLRHESGSLFHILGFIIYNNLNMTKIESRPIKGEKWKYRFFIDFEGRLDDIAVRDALKGIQQEAMDFHIIGNYKRVD